MSTAAGRSGAAWRTFIPMAPRRITRFTRPAVLATNPGDGIKLAAWEAILAFDGMITVDVMGAATTGAVKEADGDQRVF